MGDEVTVVAGSGMNQPRLTSDPRRLSVNGELVGNTNSS